MSVTNKHPLYLKHLARWQRSQDFYEGEDVVKSKNETYLKRTGQQLAMAAAGDGTLADEHYANYVDRAEVPDIYGPSVIGLVGLATRVPWKIEVPPVMQYLFENASCGIPLERLQPILITQGLLKGRLGHLVDTDPLDGQVRIALYNAEDIVNWKRRDSVVNLVVLQERKEKLEEDEIDFFAHDVETHYRVLRIDDGRYRVFEYSPTSNGDYNTGTEILARDNKDLTFQEGYLPFVFQGSTNDSEDPDSIPLDGMVLQCRQYYRLSADLYNDLYMSNTSTAVALGFEQDSISFLGTGSLITTTKGPSEADFKFVSTDGKGQANAMAMMDKKIEMAEKQSHRMTEKTSGVEASSTLSQKIYTKTATLRTVEIEAVAALEKDLRNIAIMHGVNPDLCTVISEFSYTDKEIDSTLMDVFTKAIVANTMPKTTNVEYAKAQGMFPDQSVEEIMGQLEEEAEEAEEKMLGMMNQPLPGDEDDTEDDEDEAA